MAAAAGQPTGRVIPGCVIPGRLIPGEMPARDVSAGRLAGLRNALHDDSVSTTSAAVALPGIAHAAPAPCPYTAYSAPRGHLARQCRHLTGLAAHLATGASAPRARVGGGGRTTSAATGRTGAPSGGGRLDGPEARRLDGSPQGDLGGGEATGSPQGEGGYRLDRLDRSVGYRLDRSVVICAPARLGGFGGPGRRQGAEEVAEFGRRWQCR